MGAWRLRTRYWGLVFVVLVTANALIYRTLFTAPSVSVQTFVAGKGNATLVHTTNGKTLLINTGSDASILRSLGSALPLWQRTIDLVILTAKTANLTGGLSPVQSRYHIKQTIGPANISNERITLDGVSVAVLSTKSGAYTLSYGARSLTISSSTPADVREFK